MHKLLTGVGVMCLAVLAMIMLVLTASDVIARLQRAGQPAVPTSLMMVSQPGIQRLSTFEAIVGSSYEIFVTDDQTGQTRQLSAHVANDRFPALSPDGRQVAFVSWRDGNSEIYVIDLVGGGLRNLSNHAGQDMLLASAWSPDGTLLAYTSRRHEQFDIVVVDMARGLTQNLTKSPHHDSQPVWLPDNQTLVFTSDREGTLAQYTLDLSGRHLTPYQGVNRWQTVQKTDNLVVPETEVQG